MIICGLKLTHDGAIALVDDGKLIFSYEMEKLNNNNNRFSDLLSFYSDDFLNSILRENGYERKDIDQLVIDGWGVFFAKIKQKMITRPFLLH
jgi:carbamoyltransferase